MPDHARSSHPAVQDQLDRLWALSPGADVLGLGRITALLARLGDPHRHLPPVFHVAGTNGKGSTCAFLRAGIEAAGYRVHAYTSPHLVRFNERIRLAGRLIDDEALAALLAEVLDAAGEGAHGIGASFFEVTTAAAFLAFSRTPADACVIEVGLGGRLDATNVVTPVVCGIAALGIDHQAFLGDTIAAIAAEKAGIATSGVPLLTVRYPDAVAATVSRVADAAGAPVLAEGVHWHVGVEGGHVHYLDEAGALATALPAMAGAHQVDNLGLAIAMLRHQRALAVPPEAWSRMPVAARWPARMQRLGDGPLTRRLPAAARRHGVWLDGAHNEGAAAAIAGSWSAGAPTAIVLGMLANKDAESVLRHLVTAAPPSHVVAVPVPGHAHHAPSEIARLARRHGAASTAIATDLVSAMDLIAALPVQSVLIAGSLYLAGTVLAANDEHPD